MKPSRQVFVNSSWSQTNESSFMSVSGDRQYTSPGKSTKDSRQLWGVQDFETNRKRE